MDTLVRFIWVYMVSGYFSTVYMGYIWSVDTLVRFIWVYMVSGYFSTVYMGIYGQWIL